MITLEQGQAYEFSEKKGQYKINYLKKGRGPSVTQKHVAYLYLGFVFQETTVF